MKMRFWPLVGICLICSGCGTIGKCTPGKLLRTVFLEPAVYCEPKDDARSRAAYRRASEEAWNQVRQASAGTAFSHDFESGFKDGYSEYLYAGGSTVPPPVPPRRYWNEKWQNPEGHQAIEDWYAGYREGTAAAISHGRRPCAMVPSGLPTACCVARLPEVVEPVPTPLPATDESVGQR
ncbi:MAG: hypothetical protein HUU20_10095 [Pirellulales bacterium]|nr:hypothetical protein [Pirellulales bacterium]